MKKIARVFIVAVFVPSLVLAWLAVRSLRDQQLILERQQFLLFQNVADALAQSANDFVLEQQHEFGRQVEGLLAGNNAREVAPTFDTRLQTNWPYSEVGCVVTLRGDLLCPSPTSSPAAAAFCADFGKFLGNRESVEVYWSNGKNFINAGNSVVNMEQVAQTFQQQAPNANPDGDNSSFRNNPATKGQVSNIRKVVPQQSGQFNESDQNFSKIASSEAEFRQLVGDSTEGAVARFVENKLKVLLWHRSLSDTNLIFGTQLSLDRLKQGLKPIVEGVEPPLRQDIAVALLDDNARPVAVSAAGFSANWKHPFVATELGETLPHWEMAVYLLNPAKLAQSAKTVELTLGLLIAVLLLAIGIGGWLIVADLNRQLTLARQKTDFVSNVSHELKTPLTSIRMFSELLAEGRVSEPGKRQSYLNIITAETSRLTRLINNVLDFSRMERGEKKYHFQKTGLAALVRETVETYRPHLESNGFTVKNCPPEADVSINGDRDALAQVIVNLLSNAEKYSGERKEITVEMEQFQEPLPHVEVRILDRGVGVPRGCETKIFEQFYRAHDSLGSGIQGSGLGLTLARQIARAHGGDVLYRPRDGGGSCFILRLPSENPAIQTSA